MRGTILGYDVVAGMGALAGEDGRRYTFLGPEWCGGAVQPVAGVECDFDLAHGNAARQVYPVEAPRPAYRPAPPPYHGYHPGYPKSHVTAGLLALFLGGLGVHKCYLGYTAQGIILIVANFVSLILWIVLIGLLGSFAISIICLVEAIIYLTKGEEEFHQTYVLRRRPWF